MSKAADNKKKSKSIYDKELSKFYPRSSEILIFDDIYNYDEIGGALDRLGDRLKNRKIGFNTVKPFMFSNDWSEVMDDYPVTGMIHLLQKACKEYERFWMGEDWTYEEEDYYQECLNDSNELHQLVLLLEDGRCDERDGRVVRISDPAYLAAARSLEMVMYFRDIPGGHDWIDYCIKELKTWLLRCYTTSLEVVLHRSRVYVHRNISCLETARRLRDRSKKNAENQKEKREERKKEALSLLSEYWGKRDSRDTKSSVVAMIAQKMQVTNITVWRYIEGEDITSK